MTERVWNVAVVLAASTASALVWLSSPWGIGTSHDSIGYMLEARALARGAHVLDLDPHQPPLYTLALWLSSLGAHDDVRAGARLLHTALFGLNTLLLAALVRRVDHGFPPLSLACVVAFALSPTLYDVHYMAWSESPFFGLLFLALIATRRHVEDRPGPWLAAAGLCLGLATLTRYAGAAFIGAWIVFLVLCGADTVRARLGAAARFATAALLLPAIWIVLRALSGAEPGPRALDFHPVELARMRAGLGTVVAWFHRDTAGAAFAVAAVVLTLAIPCASALAGAPRAVRRLIALIFIAMPVYVVFLLVSISLFDFHTRLDTRILSPLLALMLAALGLSGTSGPTAWRWLPRFAAAFVAVLLVVGASTMPAKLRKNTEVGLGYFSRPIMSSPIVAYLAAAQLPAIYTNSPELVRIYFDRDAQGLPPIRDPVRNVLRPEHDAELDAVLDEVRTGRAVIVHFAAFGWRRYLPGLEVFAGRLGLPALYVASDGVVFGVARAHGS